MVVRNVTLQQHETHLEHNLDEFCLIIFTELAKNQLANILKIYHTLLFNLTIAMCHTESFVEQSFTSLIMSRSSCSEGFIPTLFMHDSKS